jgi:hypothetical protein
MSSTALHKELLTEFLNRAPVSSAMTKEIESCIAMLLHA